MDERERRKRKERSDTIWTFIIIAAFLTAWPLGIALAILKGKNILPNIGMGISSGEKSGWRSTQGEQTQQRTAQGGQTYARDWEPELRRQAERAKEQTRQWSDQLRQQAQAAKERTAQWAAPVQENKQQAQQKAAQQQQQQKTAQQQQQAAQTAQQRAQEAARQRAVEAAAQKKAAQEKSAREKLKNKKLKLSYAKPMFITGLCVGSVGFLSFFGNLSHVSSFGRFLRDCSFPLGILGVGAYLAIYGFVRMRQSKRLQEYAKLLRANGKYYSIHELSERTGRPYRQVLADLQKMVDLGVWERAWIDRKNGRLMFVPYVPETAEAQPKPQEKPAAAPPKEDKRAEQVLQRIRADNDLIADEAISRKIDRIELLTGEIFRYVGQHPEREGELRTFMDYYLPQTLKILETYAQLEAQGVETDNIRKAKNEISAVLDQLSESYERQLDKLFDTDVLDISADIEVMKQMLRSDGLTADELEKAAQMVKN